MFNDIKSSTDLTKGFHQYQDSKKHDVPVQMKFNILTSGYWPSVNSAVCEIPPTLTQSISHFEAYYNDKHHGRRLTWNHSQGTAELKAIMPHQTKQGGRT